jgi:hypothetical protein
LFLVFMVGSASPASAALWGAVPRAGARPMGNDLTVLVFIVVIIGARLDRRLLHRRAAGRCCQLRRLPGAEAGAGLQYPFDGRDPNVASARALCGDQPMMILSAIRRAAACLHPCWSLRRSPHTVIFPGAKR